MTVLPRPSHLAFGADVPLDIAKRSRNLDADRPRDFWILVMLSGVRRAVGVGQPVRSNVDALHTGVVERRTGAKFLRVDRCCSQALSAVLGRVMRRWQCGWAWDLPENTRAGVAMEHGNADRADPKCDV